MYRVMSAMTAIVVVIASLVLFSDHASAHERRTIGPYEVEVGWQIEPAFVGQVNGLALNVTDTRTSQPVSGLEKTLTADVAAGGLSPFALELSALETPGEYGGAFMPTVTGSFTFHIVGKIGTQAVDEKFSSGPNTFDDIAEVATLQYPNKVPTGDDLRQRLDSIQATAEQTRLVALAALALAVIALGGAAIMRRRS